MLFLASDWNSPFHNLLLSPIHSLCTSEKSLVQISLQPCYSFCKVYIFIPKACRYAHINLQGQKWGTEAAACPGTLPSAAGLEVLFQSSSLDEFPEKYPLPTLLNHSAKLFNHFSLDCTDLLRSLFPWNACILAPARRSHVPQLICFPFCRKKALGVLQQGECELTVHTHGKGQQHPGLHWEGCGHQVIKGDPSHLHSSVGTGFGLGLPSMRCGYIRNRLANSKLQLFTR